METITYTFFILASIVLIVVPGLNVLVIISISVSHGTKRGLQTVLGTSSAMIVQLYIAALGTSQLVDSLANGFEWLRWLGVGYLLYLGINHLYEITSTSKNRSDEVSATSSYARGFIVSLTNPKTILFFSAFLPQFISDETFYLQQITLLSVTFLTLATVIDSLYALSANHLSQHFKKHHLIRFQHATSGTLFITAGVWLALMRKT